MHYVSRPQRVEAVQWKGTNIVEIINFDVGVIDYNVERDPQLRLLAGVDGAQGFVPVPRWHWIVRKPGDRTDYWPVDPDYFEDKYQKAAK